MMKKEVATKLMPETEEDKPVINKPPYQFINVLFFMLSTFTTHNTYM